MGKKVKATTKCGETFTYDHDQEVKTVEILEGNVMVEGNRILFNEVPKYAYFDLYDPKGKRVIGFHLAIDEHYERKHNIYFAGGYTVKGDNT